MATPEVEVNRDWASQRPKRTQAMPAKSLFGSSLEMQDEKQLEEMRSIDLKKYDEEKSQTSKRRGRNVPNVRFEGTFPGVKLIFIDRKIFQSILLSLVLICFLSI